MLSLTGAPCRILLESTQPGGQMQPRGQIPPQRQAQPQHQKPQSSHRAAHQLLCPAAKHEKKLTVDKDSGSNFQRQLNQKARPSRQAVDINASVFSVPVLS